MSLPKKQKRYYSFLFENSHLKIARLNEKGLKLVYFYEVKLPDGLISHGEVSDPQKLGDFLYKIKQQAKIKEDSIVVGISEHKAVNRNLKLPFLPLDEINDAVKHESSSILPFPFKEEYVDWMLVGEKENEYRKILLSAVPRNIIDGFTSAFERAKLFPFAFETTSISLFRIVPEDEKKQCFALEIKEGASTLIYIKDNTIESTSVIVDSSSIISNIDKMKTFYVENAEEFQEGKDTVSAERKIGINHPDKQEDKKQEQKASQKSDQGIKIYLCGEAVSQQIVDQIKSKLGMTPVLINPNVAQIPQDRLLEFAVLISLARKETEPPQDEKTINILPEGLETKYEEIARKKRERSIAIFLSVLFLAVLGLNMFFFIKIQNDRTALQGQLDKIDGDLVAFPPGIEQKSALVIQTNQKNKKVQEVFSAILKNASQSAVVRSLNYNSKDSEIIISGTIVSRERLLTLKEKLQETKLFTKIFIPLSSLEQNQQSEFRIKLSL